MVTDIEILHNEMSQFPVDVEAAIRKIGISFSKENMTDGRSGCIEFENGKFSITVNENEGNQRQRFTAAHELSHYFLHRNMLEIVGGLNRHQDSLYDGHAKTNLSAPFSPSHEVEANKLAANILMPKAAIQEHYDVAADNASEVALLFNVSLAAMNIRLQSLGLK